MSATILPSDASKLPPLTLVLLGAFFGVLTAFTAGCLILVALSLNDYGPHDAFLLWSFGRFVLTHHFADLYEDAALHAFQSQLRGETVLGGETTYFYYPPPFGFLLAPLALLPSTAMYLVFQATSLAAYLWAVLPAGRRRLRAAMLAILPTTALTLLAGQNGFLSGALLIGGMRLSASRPVLGGVLLGLLTYKPQVGLLVPVALVPAGRWRTVAAAALTVAAMVAGTGVLAGWDAWSAWIGSMATHAGAFASGRATDFMMPTVSAMLRQLGLSPADAGAGQLAATGLAGAGVWLCYRRRADETALAALCVATFLATPYAVFYDLPAFGAAIVLIVCDRLRAAETWTATDAALLTVAAAMPIGLTVPIGIPIGAPVLAVLLAWIVRRQLAASPQRAPVLQTAGG